MTNFRAKEWARVDEYQKQIIAPHLDKVPVSLSGIASALQIPVIASTLLAGISGEIRPSESSQSGYIIKVNRHDSVPRQRFTVAHEIAHFLLHKNEIGDGIVDSVLYRSNKSSAIEAEANRLAADMIMPASTISKWRKNNNFNNWNETTLEVVSNVFKASKPALKIRYGL